MINDVLTILKTCLNDDLIAPARPEDAPEDVVVFLDGSALDPLTFKLGTVSLLLINLEEENILRAPDRFARQAPDGTVQRIQPAIKLSLYVLFVAHFNQYEDSLYYLSRVIRYFQRHRVIDHTSTPGLSDEINQLTVELVTLPFGEQNSVWSSLRVPYHPSVLYRIRLAIFEDEDAMGGTAITEKVLRTQS